MPAVSDAEMAGGEDDLKSTRSATSGIVKAAPQEAEQHTPPMQHSQGAAPPAGQ
jgi:hypothetical protein